SRLRAAGVLGNFMRAAGRFVEHLSGLIYPLWLARYFRDHVAFEDIGQNETGMMMHLTNTSGRVRDLADCDLPVIHGEIWEIVDKDGAATAFARLILGSGGGLRKKSKSCGYSIATSCHDDNISSGSSRRLTQIQDVSSVAYSCFDLPEERYVRRGIFSKREQI